MNHPTKTFFTAVALWLVAAACALAQTDSVVVSVPESALALPDSAVVLPEGAAVQPDTAAVIAGVAGDEAFFVTPKDCNPYGIYDPTHHIRPAEWIVPGSAAVLGALCVNTAWGKHVRREVKKMVDADLKLHTSADNYLQYAPMVVAYGAYFCGWKGQHNLKDRTILLAMSAATMAAFINVAKPLFKEQRPDTGAKNSFPSGHTATAFMGAEYMWQEYRTTHPWLGYAGYGIAALTGYLRMHNNRHRINDVVAGAAVGMLSTKFAYWLYPKIFHESTGRKSSAHKQRVAAFGVPYCGGGSAGVNMAMVF